MEIIELPNSRALNLKPPSFVCDTKLSDCIVEPFPNLHSFIVLVGAARSGKSSLLINMMTNKNIYYRVFDKVIVCMPIHSIQSMKDNIFEDLPSEQVFHELDEESLNNIINQISASSDEDENTIIIIDDLTSSLKLKIVQRLLNNIINNRRHYKTSILLSVQFLNSIPLQVRKQINFIIAFKFKNNKELKNVAEEFTKYDYNEFLEIADYVFDKPHEWMCIDRDNNRIFKKFNEIQIHRNK